MRKIVFPQQSNLQPLDYRSTALPLELEKTPSRMLNFGYLNPATCLLYAVADLENFDGGDFKHKPSKIRMSSPKLRVIFGPKSEIRTFFPPKIRWSPKKKEKKKVFTVIESDFSAKIGNSNVFSAQNQVVSKKKKKRSSPKLRVIFGPKSEIRTFFPPKIR